jgi:hypothetical protein
MFAVQAIWRGDSTIRILGFDRMIPARVKMFENEILRPVDAFDTTCHGIF